MSTPAVSTLLTWLRDLLQGARADGPWEVEVNRRGRVVARATSAEPQLVVTARPVDDSKSWLATPSALWNVDVVAADDATQDAARQSLRRLRELLSSSDPGGLTHPMPTSESRYLEHSTRIAAAQARHEDALHWASFLGYMALTTQDLYPHIGVLGEPMTEAELLAAWRRTMASIRAGTSPSTIGLYVHIPFCATECTFCYCGKTDRFGKGDVDAYLDRLDADLESFAEVVDGHPIATVYFGGGTPSILKPNQLERIFNAIYQRFHVPADAQVVFEGNPDSLNDKKLRVLATVGRVTRLTIGVQTLDPETQRIARRFNTHAHVTAAVEGARRYQIPVVNIDLMAGLPGQSEASFRDDVTFAIGLEPDALHINAFVNQGWSLFAKAGGTVSAEDRARRDAMSAWATAELTKHGYGAPGTTRASFKSAAARNEQLDQLEQGDASLLAFGVPATGHAHGQVHYQADAGSDLSRTVTTDVTKRRYIAVSASPAEQRARYLVHNIGSGFSLAAFEQKFGCRPETVRPDAWRVVIELGLIEVVGDRVVSHFASRAEVLAVRGLFYGDEVLERVAATWKARYSRATDYAKRIKQLVNDDHVARAAAG